MACCSDVRLQLTGPEAEQLEEAGTELTPLLPPMEGFVVDGDETEPTLVRSWSDVGGLTAIVKMLRQAPNEEEKAGWTRILSVAMQMRPGEGLFDMEGKCGNQLPDGRCADYENRPRICREFEVGSTACQKIREMSAELVPVTLTSKPVELEA